MAVVATSTPGMTRGSSPFSLTLAINLPRAGNILNDGAESNTTRSPLSRRSETAVVTSTSISGPMPNSCFEIAYLFSSEAACFSSPVTTMSAACRARTARCVISSRSSIGDPTMKQEPATSSFWSPDSEIPSAALFSVSFTHSSCFGHLYDDDVFAGDRPALEVVTSATPVSQSARQRSLHTILARTSRRQPLRERQSGVQ